MGISDHQKHLKDDTVIVCSSIVKSKSTTGSYMLTDPIGRTIWKVVYPSFISLLFSTIYMMVNYIILSHMITDAIYDNNAIISALSLISSLEPLLLHCIPSMIGMGSSVLVSHYIGENRIEECNNAAGNSISFQLLLSVVSMVCLPFVLPLIVSSFSKPNTEGIHKLVISYFSVIIWGSSASFINLSVRSLIQGQGAAIPACFISILSTTCNLLLDVLLIIRRNLGFQGAAYSSNATAILSAMLGLLYLASTRSVIRFSLPRFRLQWRLCFRILMSGLPVFVSTISSSVISLLRSRLIPYFINTSEVTAETITSAFSSVRMIYFVAFMPLLSLAQGVLPIFAYSFGAKKNQRFTDCFKYLSIYMGILACIAEIIIFIFAPSIAQLFSSEEQYVSFFVKAIRTILSCFFLEPIIMVIFPMLQATGHGGQAGLLLACKECLILLPLQITISYLCGDYWGFVYAYPITEVLCTFLGLYFYKKSIHSIITSSQLYHEENRDIEIEIISKSI